MNNSFHLSDHSNPLVTVGITTRNRPDWLPRAVESVLDQTYRNIELFIIDDASATDETENYVKTLDDPRIRFLRLKQNEGIAANINRFFSLSKGDYICALGDDDIFLQDCVKRCVDLALHGQFEMIGFNLSLADPSGNILLDRQINVFDDVLLPIHRYIEMHFGTRGLFHIPGTFFVNRHFLNRYNLRYRPEVLGIDVFFNLECNLHSSVYFIAEPLYIQTEHPSRDASCSNRPHQWWLNYYRHLNDFLIRNRLLEFQPALFKMAFPFLNSLIMDSIRTPDGIDRIRERVQTHLKQNRWISLNHPDFIRLLLLLDALDLQPVSDTFAVDSIVLTTGWSNSIDGRMLKLLHHGCSRISKLITDSADNQAPLAIFGTGYLAILLSIVFQQRGMRDIPFICSQPAQPVLINQTVHSLEWLRDQKNPTVILSLERTSDSDVRQLIECHGNPEHPARIISWTDFPSTDDH